MEEDVEDGRLLDDHCPVDLDWDGDWPRLPRRLLTTNIQSTRFLNSRLELPLGWGMGEWELTFNRGNALPRVLLFSYYYLWLAEYWLCNHGQNSVDAASNLRASQGRPSSLRQWCISTLCFGFSQISPYFQKIFRILGISPFSKTFSWFSCAKISFL